MKKFFSVSFFLLMAVLVMGQSKLSPMTRNYLTEKTQEVLPLDSKIYNIRSVGARDYVSAFIHFTEEVDAELLNRYDVVVESEFVGIVTASIPSDQLEALSSELAIKYIEISTKVYPKIGIARTFSLVNQVQEGHAPLARPYTGKDVVVGIIDFGFQFTHANFYDVNGNSRIKRVWNQNSSSGTPPSGYSGGTELKTTAEIERAIYDSRSDYTGHGTHVAGIAAGSDKNNGHLDWGIATESDLVLVSYNTYDAGNTSLINAVRYIYDYADEVGKPAVINLSLGSHTGPHDGTSGFDLVADQLQGEGRLMVGAAGNEGGDRFHINKQFSETDTVVRSFVQYNSSYKVAMIDIWGEVGTDYSVRLVSYNKTTRLIEDSSAVYRASDVNSASIRLTGATGSISLSTGINVNNNKGNVYINYQLQSISDPYVIGIEIVSNSGEVNMWADNYYSWLSSLYRTGWTMGDDNSSVGEIGGTGNKIITVGSYTSVARSGYGQTVNRISTFSSKGPTADGRIKPDITAPGSCLISSVPNLSNVVNSSGYDGAYYNTVNGQKNYYAYMHGTSMSSPYVAGVLALWLEADPTLSPERVRDILAATSLTDSYTGSDLPNNTWGHGKINAYMGICAVVSQSSDVVSPIERDALMVYPNPTSGAFNVSFLNADSNVRISVIDVTGKLVYQEMLSSIDRGETRTFNIDMLGSGVYVVRINGERTNETHRLILNK